MSFVYFLGDMRIIDLNLYFNLFMLRFIELHIFKHNSFFFSFVFAWALILLTISIILSPDNPYQKKKGALEYVFHSAIDECI